MLDLISGLIWLAVIAAFLAPFIKTYLQRRTTPPAGQRPTAGPRGLSESGGYEPRPTPGVARRTAPEPESDVDAILVTQRRTQAPSPEGASMPTLARAIAVRRALASPEGVQNAFVLMEVLDKPLAMRETRRSPNGTIE